MAEKKEIVNEVTTLDLSNKATVTIRMRAGYPISTKNVAQPDRTVEVDNCPLELFNEVVPIIAKTLKKLDKVLKDDIRENGYKLPSEIE